MFDMVRGWLAGGGKHDDAARTVTDNVGGAYTADEVAGLDFKKAIDAHMQWKERLRGVIEGSSKESLEVATVACDDRCMLGQWIHGPGGSSHGHLGQFSQLREHHAEFHVCAAGVLAEAQAGRTQDAQRQLSGSYARASEQVKHDLIRLYLELSKSR
jgi:hypothetical protein